MQTEFSGRQANAGNRVPSLKAGRQAGGLDSASPEVGSRCHCLLAKGRTHSKWMVQKGNRLCPCSASEFCPRLNLTLLCLLHTHLITVKFPSQGQNGHMSDGQARAPSWLCQQLPLWPGSPVPSLDYTVNNEPWV